MKKRLIALLLAIGLLLPALLIGCKKSDPAGEEPPTADTCTIAGNALADYKIIYDSTTYAYACAQRVQTAIRNATGLALRIYSDLAAETELEILVGKTDRAESAAVRATYARPNVCYSIQTEGKKLVVMGEGYTTLEKAAEAFETAIADTPQLAWEGLIASGDVLRSIDTVGLSMLNRAAGTDLRIFHWNMAAPYLDPNVTPPPVPYDSNVKRGEVMADMILQYLPDIITTNEFYRSHNGNSALYDAVMGELGEYYVCLESPYDRDKPKQGADVISGKTINCNILYRRDAGLSVVSSAWRYSTEKTAVTASNPDGYVYYHGSHTAVFEQNGKKFIVSVAHYADSRTSSQWAAEHLQAVADAQAAAGGGEPLPVILTGDMYTSYASTSTESGYRYLVSQGYTDAQRNAVTNANQNISHGTFHTIGVRQIDRISEDFVWYTNTLQALCFKVPVSKDIDDTSDHYPVMADLAFRNFD